MNKIKNQIALSVLYTAIMGLGWMINPHKYGEIDNVIFMIPVLLSLSVLAIYLIRAKRIRLTNKKLQKSPLLWLFVGLLIYLILNNLLVLIEGGQVGPWHKVVLLFIATALVGVAEEGFYRGYLLNTVEKKVGIKKALLYSSILFGLLHSVNFLAGPTITETIIQVILTTAAGYLFGVIYIKTQRDLLLVMGLHGIYDFLVFNFTYLKDLNNSTRITLATPILIILWAYSVIVIKKYRA